MDTLYRQHPMNVNVFTLEFSGEDAPLEQPFIKNFNDASRFQVRVALFLAMVLIGLFGVFDSLLVPADKYIAWFIRFGVLCPAILVGVGLTYHANASKFFPWIQIVLSNLVGAGFMGMIMTSPPPANYLYYSGLMLVLMYGYGFVRLRFIWASLSGWLLVIVYEIVAWSFTGTEHKILISNTFFLVTANFIGMVGCYTIERNQRKGFYLAHQLRQEQNNVVSANSMLEQRVADRTAELASANQALERQVNERKLQEEQTRQAQKMESIGLLAGGVAHDFNNILTIILGNAGLLTLGDLSAEEIADHVGSITKSAKRGAQLVGQLLTFARKNETNYSHVNINDIAADIASLLKGTFPKNIAILSNLSNELPYIYADSGQMHQVLMNICINARDAMPSGGTLTVTTRILPGNHVRTFFPKASAEHYVSIKIGDTGFGMDDATQAKIFEPFFTTKETGKGTGLGLAVVYGIVENHHGFVRVRSAINKGTEFTVFLPVPADKNFASAEIRKKTEVARGSGETILVIDDEESIMECLSELLRQQGYAVLTAENGEKAVTLFQEHANEVALVISDKDMPRMDGEKVFQALRDINPAVKFVLLTGLIDHADKLKFIKHGMSEILLKPIEPEDLFAVINKTISRQ
jgi:Signal transduction histidine kinase regulating C4-dicarboxylate transport system